MLQHNEIGNAAMAMETRQETSTLSLYPNPTTDRVAINQIKPGSRIKIVDASSGAVQETFDVTDKSLSVETKHYKKGLYYVIQIAPQGGETESIKLWVK